MPPIVPETMLRGEVHTLMRPYLRYCMGELISMSVAVASFRSPRSFLLETLVKHNSETGLKNTEE